MIDPGFPFPRRQAGPHIGFGVLGILFFSGVIFFLGYFSFEVGVLFFCGRVEEVVPGVFLGDFFLIGALQGNLEEVYPGDIFFLGARGYL